MPRSATQDRTPRRLRTVVAAAWVMMAPLAAASAVAQDGPRLPDGAPRGSQPAEVVQRVGATEITVRFNRPSARGRDLFGALVPYDSIWNPGADEATRIELSAPVRVEGELLPAGRYSIWAIPGPEVWTLVFSRAWDVFHRPYPEGRDALRVEARPRTGPHVESLLFHFPMATRDSARLELRWGTVAVPVEIVPVQSPAGSAARDPDLQAVAEAVRDSAGAPALGLAVVQPGAEPEIAAAGARCADAPDAVTPDDLWHWGSITKSMTATLVARLVEQGVVRWDGAVGELLGDRVPDMREEYRDATFLHLLSHRAGLPANIPPYRAIRFGQTSDDPVADRLRWAEIALSQTPAGPPEETFEYSNSGYVVAGAMLEAATETPWETLVRSEVFEPLGMTRAGFGAPVEREPGEQPCGHIPGRAGDQAVRLNGDNPAAMGPAGRVHMPLADMARYLGAHANRPAGYLSPGSWETLHTVPFGGDYALGWVTETPQRGWHNGSNTMWYAEVAFHDNGRAAAVVVNDGDLAAVQPAVRALLGQLMRDDG